MSNTDYGLQRFTSADVAALTRQYLPIVNALAIRGIRGKDWYTNARLAIEDAIPANDVERFTGLVAVTSPRCSVQQNVRRALAVYRHGMAGFEQPFITSMLTVRRATEHYLETGELLGIKTRAFYENLRGNLQPVTIDVWVCRAVGIDQTKVKNPRGSMYWHAIRRACELSGTFLGLQPAEVQASLWTATLAQHGRRNLPTIDAVLAIFGDRRAYVG